MSLRLIIEDDEGATTIVPLEARAVTIGRQEGNTIQLTERNVSRHHARLAPAPEGWVIEDLNSYNGIRVNGVAIEGKVMLREGDVAQIGDYHLALCEDVDKKTLNLDRPVKAANDEEPLLVSSSSGLPRLTPNEIAELQRGYQADAVPSAPTSAPRMTYPANARQASQPSRGRIGVVVAAGGGVALVGLAIAFLLVRGGSNSETPQAQSSAPTVQNPAVAPIQPPPVPPVSEPAPAHDPAAIGTEAEFQDLGAADVEPIPDEDAEQDESAEPETPAKTDRASQTSSSRPKTARSSKPSTSPPPPPPPPPPGPQSTATGSNVDANQLLQDARVASLKGSHDLAYQLARKAYEAKRNPAALKVMGVAACKMGDANKAKAAYRKLSGANKEGLAKVCESQGIKL